MKHIKYKQEQMQKDVSGLQKELETLIKQAAEVKRDQLATTTKDTNARGVVRRKMAVIRTLIHNNTQ